MALPSKSRPSSTAAKGSECCSGLDALLAEIGNCRICRDTPRRKPLPHEPRPVLRPSLTARICIAGQAPGTRVHASGVPFSDPSGVRLRAWMGVTESEFYDRSRIAIVPMGFCFPGHDAKGGDLPPRAECSEKWRQRVFDAMPQLELVLAIGLHAQRWHFGRDARGSLSETVSDWRRLFQRDARPRCLPLPHPSWRNNTWLKANPWFEQDVLPVVRCEVRARLAAS